MKNRNRYTVMPIFILLIHVVGCASTTAPKGWLPSQFVAQHESYGGWVSVRYHTGEPKAEVRGELIVIHTNQVLILSISEELISIPVNSISRMELTAYDANSEGFAMLTTVGTLSTISHGVLLIGSAPYWIIGGYSATTATSLDAQVIYPAKPLDAFRAYARFPQGISKAIDIQFLKPKGKEIKILIPTELLESLQRDQSAPLVELIQQNAVKAEAIVAAEEDAKDANTYDDTRHWSDLFSVGFAKRRYAPSLPPGRLLGKPPEYVAFYAAAYSAKAKSRHVKRLWIVRMACCTVNLGVCLFNMWTLHSAQ